MTNNKRTLYVGGLADEVDVSMLKIAFAPFGDIVDVNLPLDYQSQKHRGFAFVEYQLPEDAADAIDNMDNGEILSKTIRVSIAKPLRMKDNTSRPIWSEDEYLQERQKAEFEQNKNKVDDVDINYKESRSET